MTAFPNGPTQKIGLKTTVCAKPTAGTCPFCNQKGGILSREHPECRRTYQAGWNEIVRLAAGAKVQQSENLAHMQRTK